MPEIPAGAFPVWLRRPVVLHGQRDRAHALVRELGLHTVCQEARCPNLGECWSHGNVSFMILGDTCTRRCSFCAVQTGRPGAVDWEEPARLAEAIDRLGVRYAVITSVARDDLEDEGAGLFAACVRAVRQRAPGVLVEVLTPDFHAGPERIGEVIEAGPAVYSHNLETVRRLSRIVRPQGDYDRSVRALSVAKRLAQGRAKTKSGLMVGFGERPAEVREAMRELRGAGCDLLTIGQYLRPTPSRRDVSEFIAPEQFETYRTWGEEMGFEFVASGPYVRSSYNALEAFQKGG